MLSVCLIAKNEERHLARCLASVRGLADEIILVDTGSTDRTIEIAQAHGARVSHFTWQDDFSLARNVSLEQATGEWILVLDADEAIAERDHAVIRSWLRREDLNAVMCRHRHYLSTVTMLGWQPGPGGYEEGKPYPGFVDYDCRRLFRNRPWLRFRNRVHEELVSLDPARPLIQERAEWVIHHFGKLGEKDLLLAKGEAYLRMGLKKIEDAPESPMAHYELAVQYMDLRRYDDAIREFECALRLSPRFRDASICIALCYRHMGQHARALATLREAAWTLPKYAAEIAFEEGNAHRALGDIVAAEGAYRRALSLNDAFVPVSVNLAVMLHGAGRTAEALTCLDRALQKSPQNGYLLKTRAHLGGALVRSLLQREALEEARDLLTNVVDAVTGSPAEARIFAHVRAGRFELAKKMLKQPA